MSPSNGRRYAVERSVCLGDVLPSGEVRLEALARYLQDVASDDGIDAAIDADQTWVVRRTALTIERRPVLGEALEIVTWASGAGARWAERRTSIRTRPGGLTVDATALWVCMDATTRRPARLSARFWEMYGEAVAGRPASPRLTHPDPPADPDVNSRQWPLRVSDIDVFDHVNNAATWAALDDELHRYGGRRRVGWAELEYRSAIDPDTLLCLSSQVTADEARIWLVGQDAVQASGVVRWAAGS